MHSKYEQIKYIKKWNMKIIINNSSWRLNYELPQNKINEQLRSQQLDIERAKAWSWGLPETNTSWSIFARHIYIMKVTDIIQPTKLLGGVDITNATNQKYILLLLLVFDYIIKFYKKAYKIAEYTHSNATQQFKIEL
ncbi:hypothetical protein [Spiroplasma endosymbiont of Polydrusus formosus]|uniref:hypothetical protein n=1 Tax=Spiroplasma endosymbiont of Polydrusus formosus TaxID=3139326 RepID=UPI0035B53B4E